jgi:hypothetical protein
VVASSRDHVVNFADCASLLMTPGPVGGDVFGCTTAGEDARYLTRLSAAAAEVNAASSASRSAAAIDRSSELGMLLEL